MGLVELVELFDSYLAALGDADDGRRAHLVAARAAAERGVKLSNDLMQSLRAAD